MIMDRFWKGVLALIQLVSSHRFIISKRAILVSPKSLTDYLSLCLYNKTKTIFNSLFSKKKMEEHLDRRGFIRKYQPSDLMLVEVYGES